METGLVRETGILPRYMVIGKLVDAACWSIIHRNLRWEDAEALAEEYER